MHETSDFYSIITFSYTKYFVHAYTVDVYKKHPSQWLYINISKNYFFMSMVASFLTLSSVIWPEDHHIVEDILKFKVILLYENYNILFPIWLKFVPNDQINNEIELVSKMACQVTGVRNYSWINDDLVYWHVWIEKSCKIQHSQCEDFVANDIIILVLVKSLIF